MRLAITAIGTIAIALSTIVPASAGTIPPPEEKRHCIWTQETGWECVVIDPWPFD